MMKYRKVLQESKVFKLVEFRRDHKKWFEVQVDKWQVGSWHTSTQAYLDILNHFDPNKNKTFGGNTRWRFWNREEAEKNYLYAVMRWS